MPDSEDHRLERLMIEHYGKVMSQISDLKAVTANRFLEQDAKINRLDSWRVRESTDTVNLYKINKEQMHILEELNRAEAKRAGFYTAIKVFLLLLPVISIACTAIVWISTHAK